MQEREETQDEIDFVWLATWNNENADKISTLVVANTFHSWKMQNVC